MARYTTVGDQILTLVLFLASMFGAVVFVEFFERHVGSGMFLTPVAAFIGWAGSFFVLLMLLKLLKRTASK